MSHNHHSSIKSLKLAFFLNLGFTIIEFVGGVLTNSTAILADAIHDLGDSIALAQAWYFESLSKKKGSSKYTYGYRRFTLIGAIISALILLLTSFYVLNEAIPRIINPEHSDAEGMVVLAIFGIAVNGFAMFKLAKGKGANIQIIALHLLEDVLGWVAILIVAIILLFEDIHILDPILAILITLYILVNVIKQLKNMLPIFLQAVPTEIDIKALEKQIISIDNVHSVHHLHVWSLDGNNVVLTLHLISNKILSPDEYSALKSSFKKIVDNYGIYHSTLEIEWPEEICRVEENSLCK